MMQSRWTGEAHDRARGEGREFRLDGVRLDLHRRHPHLEAERLFKILAGDARKMNPLAAEAFLADPAAVAAHVTKIQFRYRATASVTPEPEPLTLAQSVARTYPSATRFRYP
jgi:hypothetical protein